MKTILLRIIIRSSKIKYLVGLIVLLILFSVLMFFATDYIKTLTGISILDTKFSYKKADVISYFTTYGKSGILTYNKIQIIDTIYPIIYSLSLSSILYRLFSKTKTVSIILIPIIAAYFDYLENILLFISTLQFPNLDTSIIRIASFSTSLKWSLVYISIVFVIIGFIRKIKTKANT